jgi:hypothetical protein
MIGVDTYTAEQLWRALLWARSVDCGCCSSGLAPEEGHLREIIKDVDQCVEQSDLGSTVPTTGDEYYP